MLYTLSEYKIKDKHILNSKNYISVKTKDITKMVLSEKDYNVLVEPVLYKETIMTTDNLNEINNFLKNKLEQVFNGIENYIYSYLNSYVFYEEVLDIKPLTFYINNFYLPKDIKHSCGGLFFTINEHVNNLTEYENMLKELLTFEYTVNLKKEEDLKEVLLEFENTCYFDKDTSNYVITDKEGNIIKLYDFLGFKTRKYKNYFPERNIKTSNISSLDKIVRNKDKKNIFEINEYDTKHRSRKRYDNKKYNINRETIRKKHIKEWLELEEEVQKELNIS